MYKKVLIKLSGESLMDGLENVSKEKTLKLEIGSRRSNEKDNN